MITATFTDNRKTLSLEVEGHADFAPRGQDIVCASATALTLALAQTVLYNDGNGFFGTSPTVKLEPGNTRIICDPLPRYRSRVVTEFETVFAGFTVISHNFGEYVKVLRHREN